MSERRCPQCGRSADLVTCDDYPECAVLFGVGPGEPHQVAPGTGPGRPAPFESSGGATSCDSELAAIKRKYRDKEWLDDSEVNALFRMVDELTESRTWYMKCQGLNLIEIENLTREQGDLREQVVGLTKDRNGWRELSFDHAAATKTAKAERDGLRKQVDELTRDRDCTLADLGAASESLTEAKERLSARGMQCGPDYEAQYYATRKAYLSTAAELREAKVEIARLKKQVEYYQDRAREKGERR